MTACSTGRFVRATVLVVAAMLLWVPPLVRAASPADRTHASPLTLRLNRGFDAPETKPRLTAPAHEIPFPPSKHGVESATPPSVAPFAVDVAIPAFTHEGEPGIVRGPPR